jgi:hypothetical protein
MADLTCLAGSEQKPKNSTNTPMQPKKNYFFFFSDSKSWAKHNKTAVNPLPGACTAPVTEPCLQWDCA